MPVVNQGIFTNADTKTDRCVTKQVIKPFFPTNSRSAVKKSILPSPNISRIDYTIHIIHGC
ncbi:MAG: hypothetical protein ACK6BN_17665 [Pseudanabaena sp.]|nr:hypothetical protein [Pseudanabaena sp. M53BS1SP1A06MG]MCA6581518.1 hypothetical protein [Pseudanabaena sp. M34BS1SP1A06MG]MCA6594358.1 hypothetical protein [Pseudanabaena sp. M38BS1SP1A06MG]MCA6602732.1 hypothetical protein [Pseudanabaena sp. M57BS1SP1A06MG]MCE2975880.1 hypothetical protein [Pseudanabaena sp. CoA8_M7]